MEIKLLEALEGDQVVRKWSEGDVTDAHLSNLFGWELYR